MQCRDTNCTQLIQEYLIKYAVDADRLKRNENALKLLKNI